MDGARDSLRYLFIIQHDSSEYVAQADRRWCHLWNCKTDDGGDIWGTLHTGTTALLTGIHFVDESTGFISGSDGTILKTTNGGGTPASPELLLTAPDVAVYPNLVQNEVVVEIESVKAEQDILLSVYDLTGVNLKSSKIKCLPDENQVKRNVDLSNLPAGIYIYKVSSAARLLKTGKLVVE